MACTTLKPLEVFRSKAQTRPASTLDERENNKTLEVVKLQIQEGLANYPITEVDNLVLAYEPVWAIGTGKTATDEMAQEVHSYVRGLLVELFGDAGGSSIRILYGGSMKSDGAENTRQ